MKFLLILWLVCAVFTPSYSLDNVGLDKTATQCGIYIERGEDYGPEKALDGNTNPDLFNGKTCAVPDTRDSASGVSPQDKDGPAWWRVDLGQEMDVYQVRIYSRDVQQEALDDTWVFVSNILRPLPTDENLCGEITNGRKDILDVQCNYKNQAQYKRGRYVMIKRKETATSLKFLLQLCEVEIFSCSPGTWGMNLRDGLADCVRKCPGSCQNGEACRVSDGTCPSGCTDGFWGRSCDQKCHCAGAASCDVITGSCGTAGCDDGWIVGNGGNCINELSATPDVDSKGGKSDVVGSNVENGSNTGLIAGMVVMAVVIVALVIVLVVIVIRKRQEGPSESNDVDLNVTKQPSNNAPAPVPNDNPGYYEELHRYENSIN